MKQTQILIRTSGSNVGHYAPCHKCPKHPHYEQPPMTLHAGNICVICGTPLKEFKEDADRTD